MQHVTEDSAPRRSSSGPTLRGQTSMLGARPSLGLFLGTLTCCAIYFAVARHLLPRQPVTLFDWLWFSTVAIYTAFCWSAAIWLSYQTVWHSGDRRMQPGEGLLWCIGTLLFVEVTLLAIPSENTALYSAILVSARALVPLMPTLSRHLPNHWKRFLVLIVVLYAIVPLLGLLGVSAALATLGTEGPWSYSRPALALGTLGLMIAWDDRQHRRWQWGHWAGVACLAVWLLPRW